MRITSSTTRPNTEALTKQSVHFADRDKLTNKRNTMKKVYLAGPITGLNYKGATDWREEAKTRLNDVGIAGFSPMRAKEHLKNRKVLVASGYLDSAISNPKAIVCRDHNDVYTSDAILVNLLGAERVSIGTAMEIAWAHAYRKPIVLVMEKKGNLHEHGMLTEVCGYRVTNLDDAYSVLHNLLNA